ncbi:MAG TPA: hypothetical protein VEC14_01120 [Reyranellaceae bacterium]|nr:hypothetical protein [Reyranellaceae bacterium]
MLKVHEFGADTKAAVIGDGEGCVIALQGGRNKVVLKLPPPVVATLRADLPEPNRRDQAERPATPKNKDWTATMRRIDQGRPTTNDADAIRTLLLYLGVIAL